MLHAANLINFRPSAYNIHSPIQLAQGSAPKISHLRRFGCQVYVPIPPPQRSAMGPLRKSGIYVGYETVSIIRFLDPLTGDCHTARFADCIFDEDLFPTLGGGNQPLDDKSREITWKATGIHAHDPRTVETNREVQKILDLHSLANQLPDHFSDLKTVTKSHVHARNAPERVEIPKKNDGIPAPAPRPKRTRIPVSQIPSTRGRPKKKDKRDLLQSAPVEGSQLRPGTSTDISVHEIPDLNFPISEIPSEVVCAHIGAGKLKDLAPGLGNPVEQEDVPDALHDEMAINYVNSGESYNRAMANVDVNFAKKIASIIDLDPEPNTLADCKKRSDWKDWQKAITAELLSLNKREVFGPVCLTPPHIRPVGHKWVFVRKRNENNEVVRYKARLVAQGFTQRPGVDFEETYSPVMDGITFRYLISMAVNMDLKMKLMDVVTAYLYGNLDSDIYMKVPEGIPVPNQDRANKSLYSVQLKKSLYGLKQSGRMWYNRLSDFLHQKGYASNEDCPCVFIRRSQDGFCIISVYVDDLNIIGTPDDIEEASSYLMSEFEMKDLGKTKFCLGLQLEHSPAGILVHQSAYTQKVLERFGFEKAYPSKTPMVGRSLQQDKDPFRPKEEGEEILGPEFPYLSAVGALMYLANCTRPDIAFAVNLLARYSSEPTKRHWKGVKDIFRYIQGTKDLGLFYQKNQDLSVVGYADAGYLSDPHTSKSQTGYVFLCGGTAISWKSSKQTLVSTSTNHSEIIALYEASRECVWLRRVVSHIQMSCGLNTVQTPTIIYEDNAACVAQVQTGYVKSNLTKHINPKFFYAHELQKMNEVKVLHTKSCENLADLFTKSLPASSFERCVRGIGMMRLREMQGSGGESSQTHR